MISPTKTGIFSKAETEQLIVSIRLALYNQGRPCNANAIWNELDGMNIRLIPSPSTIGRVLARAGLTHKKTGRYQGERCDCQGHPVGDPE